MKRMRHPKGKTPTVFTQLIFLLLLLSCWPASTSLALPIHKIKLPPGFKLSLFAHNVPNARSMTLSPNGTLFVGTRKTGRVSIGRRSSMEERCTPSPILRQATIKP